MTEIGEKGINISGGQKARIALARAVYRDADIVLMDDVLAAVDVHVGERLMTDCICGAAMAGKTRVLCTNQLHVLPRCDRVVVLDRGEIVQDGTYQELMARPAGPLAMLVAKHEGQQQQQQGGANAAAGDNDGKVASAEAGEEQRQQRAKVVAASSSGITDVAEHGDRLKADGAAGARLVEEEERKEGQVALAVVGRYLSAGSTKLPLLVMGAAFILGQLLAAFADYWLALWTNVGRGDASLFWYYETGYAVMAIASTIIVLLRALRWAMTFVRAAEVLHNNLLENVLYLPMAFFDTTPTGRILTRFARDVDQIDTMLSSTCEMMCDLVLQVAGAIAVAAYVVPYILLPILAALPIYKFFARYFRSTTRELQRLESVSRAPIFAQFSETLAGVQTIRAYRDGA
eukprot:SAG11_NODE_717_length_7606_cov_5.968563_4_plen_403_part_00